MHVTLRFGQPSTARGQGVLRDASERQVMGDDKEAASDDSTAQSLARRRGPGEPGRPLAP